MEDAELVERNGVLYVRFADGYEMPYEGADVQLADQTDPNLPSPEDQASALDAMISQPRREYQFGDVGSRAGNDTLGAAGALLSGDGTTVRGMLPDSVQQYFPPELGGLADGALGGLLGLVGLGEKGIGYGAEALDAGARGIADAVGYDWPYAPGTSAEKLMGDIIGGLDAYGAAPEGRMIEAVSRAAAPVIRGNAARAAGDFIADDSGALIDPMLLAKRLGGSIDADAVKAMRERAMYDPGLSYETEKTFIDPVGRLMVDTGPTYEGKKLREYQSLDTLQRRGQKLSDYLKGTPMGDALAQHMPDIRVGITETPGFEAGFGPPKDGLPGVLVIGSDASPDRLPGLFEHEMQHGYQYILGMPRGTTPSEMSDDMARYMIDVGIMRPAQSARISNAAAAQGLDRGTARYLSTIGEAEARAAQLRQDWVTGGRSYGSLGAPSVEQYRYNPNNFDMGMDFWSLPQDSQQGFLQWWQRQNGGRP